MERTESKSIQVHPDDEQYFIDVLQKFHWNLQSSQTVHIKDSHTELRGDKLYSVTEQEKYIKLLFTRAAHFPNKDKYEKLEKEFFNMSFLEMKKTKGAIITICIGLLFLFMTVCTGIKFFSNPFSYLGLLITAGGVLWYMNVKKTNESIAETANRNNTRRNEIIAELDQLNAMSVN